MADGRCDTCKADKVCDHDRFGFENCDNYIPADEVSELEAAVYVLEEIKRERLVEELKKGNLFEKKDGVTMMTRLSGGIFLPPDSEGGEENEE